MNFFVFWGDLLKHTSQTLTIVRKPRSSSTHTRLLCMKVAVTCHRKLYFFNLTFIVPYFFQISTDMNNFSSLTCTLNNSSCLITVIKCVLWNFNLENMQNCQRRQLSSYGGLHYFGYAENLIHSAALNGLNTSLRVVWPSRGTRKHQTPVYARFGPVCWKGTDDNHQVKQFGYLALFIELQKGWKVLRKIEKIKKISLEIRTNFYNK